MIIFNAVRNICCRRIIQNPRPFYIRAVSTSKKNSDGTAVHTETPYVKPEEATTVEPKREWRTFGFDDISEAKDRMWAWSTNIFLVFISVSVVFIFAYYPDFGEHSWVQREAFIELRRREVLGLPLVDPNYVDPATISLPADEELDDDDIII